jgi:hypothetical protein
LFKKIKVGFELVGHTHEDVDQMFSGIKYTFMLCYMICYSLVLICFIVFADSLRTAERIRTLDELKLVVGNSYQKCRPQVHEIWDTMNFDAVVKDIGQGTTAGIQGGHHVPQEEKPHQFKIVKVDGRAQLYWKPLSTTKGWTMLDKPLLKVDSFWPAKVPMVQRKPADTGRVRDITDVVAKLDLLYSDDYNPTSQDGTLVESWERVIEQHTTPTIALRQSPTWQTFLELVNPALLNASHLRIIEVDVNMDGGHEESKGEEQSDSDSDAAEFNSQEKWIDVIAPEEERMKVMPHGRSFTQKCDMLHLKVGNLYCSFCRLEGTSDVEVSIGECLEILEGEKIKIHWWTDRLGSWKTKLKAQSPYGIPWTDEIIEDSLFPEIIKLTSMGRIGSVQKEQILGYLKRVKSKARKVCNIEIPDDE